MTSIRKHYHSVYRGYIKDSKPIATQNLLELIGAIKMPGSKTVDLIERIRTETDPTIKGQLKTQLNAYTPCVICGNNRTYSEILEFSGLMALDFDKLESVEYATELKHYIFDEYPFVYATWLSSSGKGVRALVRVKKVETPEQFKAHYGALERNHMEQYPGYDPAPKNAVLPLFQSYDPELLYRKVADEYDEIYIPPKVERFVPKVTRMVSYQDRTRAESRFLDKVNSIDSAGHPVLRAASFVLGGHVGAGYLTFEQAVHLAHFTIENHWYLSQKQAVYKRTATEMIEKGATMPLHFGRKSIV